MRKAALALSAALLLTAACGDDDGGSAADLGDDPSEEQCLDLVREFFDTVEVPDGVDASDGIDEDEQEAVDAAFDDAAEEVGVDPNDDDHPCNTVLDDMDPEEFLAFLEDLDPEIVALLGFTADTGAEE